MGNNHYLGSSIICDRALAKNTLHSPTSIYAHRFSGNVEAYVVRDQDLEW